MDSGDPLSPDAPASVGEASATGLSGCLSKLGLELGRLKTGTPFRWEYLPVRIVARLGVQIELVQKQSSNRIPSLAMRSRFGVWLTTLPYALKIANKGYEKAAAEDPGFGEGINLVGGRVTNQAVADSLKGQFQGVVILGGASNGSVALLATVSPELTKLVQAGKIIQTIAPIVGGKGGGRPENARGGGKDVSKLEEALAKARSLLT